jgi:hypothetical protein
MPSSGVTECYLNTPKDDFVILLLKTIVEGFQETFLESAQHLDVILLGFNQLVDHIVSLL